MPYLCHFETPQGEPYTKELEAPDFEQLRELPPQVGRFVRAEKYVTCSECGSVTTAEVDAEGPYHCEGCES